MAAPSGILSHPVKATVRHVRQLSGGPARARVVIVLGVVLALDSADVSTIGAISSKLETALHISNLQLGLLASLPSAVIALATIPVGVLSDRVRRLPLLTGGIVVWSVAQAASGASQSFLMLLLLRLALGVGSTPTGPTLVSLVGDYIPARDRGYVWGLILSGELLGAGFGFLVSGELASLASWRWSFYVLAVPSLLAALAVRRWLPEPARGGASRINPGDREIVSCEEADARPPAEEAADEFEESEAQEQVEEAHVPARAGLVLREDPTRMDAWRASRYVLRVPTNLILIVASALGYFYFTGVETFAVVLVGGQYDLASGTAVLVVAGIGLGALAGVLAGGAMGDWLLHRGHVNSRIMIGGVGFIGAALLFAPGILTYTLAISLPLYVLAGMFFAARNPTLDAARLDVMHHRLWGRAEAVRTLLRRVAVAAAPVAFGALADSIAHGGKQVSGAHGFGAHASAYGLHLAFLVFLVMLAAGGVLTLLALRTYPADVSTAVASEAATASRGR
jgi:MFS family permease